MTNRGGVKRNRSPSGVIADRSAAISPLMALLIVPLIAVIGLVVETSNWFYTARSMQNAADSAALAVATSGCTDVAACQLNAGAVTQHYGFTNGVNDVTVASTANTAPCPSGASNCYRVTLNKKVPFYLVRVVGFMGDTTTSTGALGQTVGVSATAKPRAPGAGYCIIALAHGMPVGQSAFTIKGGPEVDLGACDVLTNASGNCTGQSGEQIATTEYVGAPGGCGLSQVQVSPLADPYAVRVSNVPANSCGADTSGQTISGAVNWTSFGASTPKAVCGDLRLTGNVTLATASPGSVVIIEKGNLNLNGFTLSVPSGSGLTVIFSGNAAGPHKATAGFITGSGTADFAAPSSGVWSGIAMFQDPRLTTPTSQTYAGNSPTFDITGLLYLPYVSLTLKGAINHKIGGPACIGLVVDQLLMNGTSATLQHPPAGSATDDCLTQAGLLLPTAPGAGARPALVQ